MEEKDFQRIQEMMASTMRDFRGEVAEVFDQRIGVLEESFQHKLDLVVEGQQMLAEKLEENRVKAKG